MTLQKTDILKYIKHLNEYKKIKIQGTDKERLVFINSDEVFNIFGAEEKGVLTPFNDYTYNWLNSFLYNTFDLIERKNHNTYEELEEDIRDNIGEWADSETDIYTSDLTEWLHDNNSNVYYLGEVQKEYGNQEDGFKLLMMAQYRAIEELFYNALRCLIDDLKTEFEEVNE